MQSTAALHPPFVSPDDNTLVHRRKATRNALGILGAGAGLSLIILIAAALRFYNLGASGYGNEYYAATVKSMLTSWHNFFYAAYEPGGSVTVDKPPLGFWIQAASAAIFGLNGFALALPQALAGVLSVPLLFYLARRTFGNVAGLIAALVLAVTPVAVATDRNNTIDGMLVFVLLLAAWAFILAAESGKLRWLLAGAVLVGLGFNIKMLQAYLPLPAFYAIYLLGGQRGRGRPQVSPLRRILYLALATFVLLTVSLSWALAVDLTPPDQRPYIGSSTDNTVMELIIGHNGLRRLLPGRPRNGDGRPQTTDGGPIQPAAPDSNVVAPPADGSAPGQPAPDGSSAPPANGQGIVAPPPGKPLAGGPVISVDGRTIVVHGRDGEVTVQVTDDTLIQSWYGEPMTLADITTNTPLGVWGELQGTTVIAAELRPGLPPPPPNGRPGIPPQDGQFGQPPQNIPPQADGPGGGQRAPGFQNEIGTPGALRLFTQPLVDQASWLLPLAAVGAVVAVFQHRLRWPLSREHTALLLWGLWLATEIVFFSVANLFHAYYLIMLAPPLGALVGIGLAALWHTYQRRAWIGTALIIAGLILTAAFQAIVLKDFPDVATWLTPIIVGGTLIAVAGLILLRRAARLAAGALCLGLTALLAAPATWSAITALDLNPNVNLPNAGPQPNAATHAPLPGAPPRADARLADLLAYLEPRTQDTAYLIATLSARDASPLILATGRPVLTFGGFGGGDQIITADELAEMVSNGELRYVLVSLEQLRGRHDDLAQWIAGNCTAEDWSATGQAPFNGPETPPQLSRCG